MTGEPRAGLYRQPAGCGYLGKLNLAGDHAPVAVPVCTRIAYGVLQKDEHPQLIVHGRLVDQDRTLPEQVAIAFKNQIDHGIEQRMAGADELRHGLARHVDQVLLEGKAFIARKDRIARADDPIAFAYDGRDMGGLVTPGFPLPQGAAKVPEGRVEEGGDEVGLETARLRALHLLPDRLYAGDIHGVVSQCVVGQQVAEPVAIHRVVDDLE